MIRPETRGRGSLRLLLDVNVILDVFMDRTPHADASSAVLSMVDRGEASGFVAAHTVTTLYFLLDRRLDRERARRGIADLLRIVEVVPVDEGRLLQAIAYDWDDFEDAVQAACAMTCRADVLVTRNGTDFERAACEVRSPNEMLALQDVESAKRG